MLKPRQNVKLQNVKALQNVELQNVKKWNNTDRFDYDRDEITCQSIGKGNSNI